MIDRPKFRGSRGIFSYLCAGIFFLGICYGLLLVIAGELPKDYLFYLIFPAALMIYFLRLGRRISRRNFPNG
jgi:hypothetical protein